MGKGIESAVLEGLNKEAKKLVNGEQSGNSMDPRWQDETNVPYSEKGMTVDEGAESPMWNQ